MANENNGLKPANVPEESPAEKTTMANSPEPSAVRKPDTTAEKPAGHNAEQAAEKTTTANSPEPTADKTAGRQGGEPDASSDKQQNHPSDGEQRTRKGRRRGSTSEERQARQDNPQTGQKTAQDGTDKPHGETDSSQTARQQSRRTARQDRRQEDRTGDRHPGQDGSRTNGQPANRAGRDSATATVAATAGDAKNRERNGAGAGKDGNQGGRTSRYEHRTDRTVHRNERGNGPADRTAGKEVKKAAKASPKKDARGSQRTAHGTSPAANGGRKWTWKEYSLQLLVVLVGVIVTLIGSGMVTRWQEQRKVRSVMQLVYGELKTNGVEMDRICRHLDHDRRGMLLLQKHGMDYRTVPVDSLKKYQYILGETDTFELRSDALDVLRTTGTITSVSDRQMLFEVLECYSRMEHFAASVEKYNDQKMLSLNHLFAAGLDGSIGGSDPVETWRVMMNDRMCSAFIGMMGNWFGNDLTEGEAVARIGRVVETLNEKYRFE